MKNLLKKIVNLLLQSNSLVVYLIHDLEQSLIHNQQQEHLNKLIFHNFYCL